MIKTKTKNLLLVLLFILSPLFGDDFIETNSTKIKFTPKLVIIIDDITTKEQVNKIQQIDLNITMSFLPESNDTNQSITLGYQDTSMLHLPLEGVKHEIEQNGTLHITNSFEEINKAVNDLLEKYPKIKYINNHMGSVFTANYEAMNALFYALKRKDIHFLDSITTSKSKGKFFAHLYDIDYHSRDIFIDNIQEYKYIENQLIKAVNLAFITGEALIIGHPHDITFEVIKNSDYLLNELDVVYLKDL